MGGWRVPLPPSSSTHFYFISPQCQHEPDFHSNYRGFYERLFLSHNTLRLKDSFQMKGWRGKKTRPNRRKFQFVFLLFLDVGGAQCLFYIQPLVLVMHAVFNHRNLFYLFLAQGYLSEWLCACLGWRRMNFFWETFVLDALNILFIDQWAHIRFHIAWQTLHFLGKKLSRHHIK